MEPKEPSETKKNLADKLHCRHCSITFPSHDALVQHLYEKIVQTNEKTHGIKVIEAAHIDKIDGGYPHRINNPNVIQTQQDPKLSIEQQHGNQKELRFSPVQQIKNNPPHDFSENQAKTQQDPKYFSNHQYKSNHCPGIPISEQHKTNMDRCMFYDQQIKSIQDAMFLNNQQHEINHDLNHFVNGQQKNNQDPVIPNREQQKLNKDLRQQQTAYKDSRIPISQLKTLTDFDQQQRTILGTMILKYKQHKVNQEPGISEQHKTNKDRYMVYDQHQKTMQDAIFLNNQQHEIYHDPNYFVNRQQKFSQDPVIPNREQQKPNKDLRVSQQQTVDKDPRIPIGPIKTLDQYLKTFADTVTFNNQQRKMNQDSNRSVYRQQTIDQDPGIAEQHKTSKDRYKVYGQHQQAMQDAMFLNNQQHEIYHDLNSFVNRQKKFCQDPVIPNREQQKPNKDLRVSQQQTVDKDTRIPIGPIKTLKDYAQYLKICADTVTFNNQQRKMNQDSNRSVYRQQTFNQDPGITEQHKSNKDQCKLYDQQQKFNSDTMILNNQQYKNHPTISINKHNKTNQDPSRFINQLQTINQKHQIFSSQQKKNNEDLMCNIDQQQLNQYQAKIDQNTKFPINKQRETYQSPILYSHSHNVQNEARNAQLQVPSFSHYDTVKTGVNANTTNDILHLKVTTDPLVNLQTAHKACEQTSHNNIQSKCKNIQSEQTRVFEDQSELHKLLIRNHTETQSMALNQIVANTVKYQLQKPASNLKAVTNTTIAMDLELADNENTKNINAEENKYVTRYKCKYKIPKRAINSTEVRKQQTENKQTAKVVPQANTLNEKLIQVSNKSVEKAHQSNLNLIDEKSEYKGDSERVKNQEFTIQNMQNKEKLVEEQNITEPEAGPNLIGVVIQRTNQIEPTDSTKYVVKNLSDTNRGDKNLSVSNSIVAVDQYHSCKRRSEEKDLSSVNKRPKLLLDDTSSGDDSTDTESDAHKNIKESYSRKHKSKQKQQNKSDSDSSDEDDSQSDSSDLKEDLLILLANILRGRKKNSINKLINLMKTKKKTTKKHKNKPILYSCKLCSIHFMEKRKYQKHLKNNSHDTKKKRCEYCKLKFPKKTIQEHIMEHHEKINFKLKDFNIITDLSSSDSSDDGNNKKETSECESVKKTLIQSQEAKPLTSNEGQIKQTLDKNMINVHNINFSNTSVDKRKTVENSDGHKKICKPFVVRINPKVKNDELGNKVYTCDKCDTSFLHWCTWKNHLREDVHVLETKTQCPLCHLNFTQQSLKKHIEKHHNEKFNAIKLEIVSSKNIQIVAHNKQKNIHMRLNPRVNSKYVSKKNVVNEKRTFNMKIHKTAFTSNIKYNPKNKKIQNIKSKKSKIDVTSNSEHIQKRKSIEYKKHTSTAVPGLASTSYSNTIYKCNICKIYFLTAHALTRHLYVNRHNIMVAKCQVCNLYFSYGVIKRHCRIHHEGLKLRHANDFKVVVRSRKRKYAWKNQERNIDSSHEVKKGKGTLSQPNVDKEKSLKIQEDNKYMPAEQQSQHQPIEQGEICQQISSKVKYSDNVDNRLYKCSLCDVHFIKKRTFLLHVTDEKHRVIKHFPCPLCSFTFSAISLKKHIHLQHFLMRIEKKDFIIVDTVETEKLNQTASSNTTKDMKKIELKECVVQLTDLHSDLVSTASNNQYLNLDNAKVASEHQHLTSLFDSDLHFPAMDSGFDCNITIEDVTQLTEKQYDRINNTFIDDDNESRFKILNAGSQSKKNQEPINEVNDINQHEYSDHDKKNDGIDNNDEIQIKELPENSENIVGKNLVNETENLISADNLRETVISGNTTGITMLSEIVIKEPNQTTDQQNLLSESLLTNQQKVEDCSESIIMSTTTEKNDKDPIINEDKLKTEIDTVAANVSKSNSSFMDLKEQHSIHESAVNIIAKGLEITDCTVTDFQTENSCDSESILSHNCILDQDNEAKQCLKEKGVARYLDTDYVENKIENNDVPEKIEPHDKLNNVHTYSLDRCMSNSREDLLKTLGGTGDSISVTQTQVEEHTTYNTNTHKQKTGEFQEIQQTSDLSFCIDKDDFLNIEIQDKPETLSEITEYLNTNKENDKATIHTENRTTENSVLSNVPTNSHTKSFKCINDTTAPSTSDKYPTNHFKNNSNTEIIDEYTSVKKNVIETNNVDNESRFKILNAGSQSKNTQEPINEFNDINQHEYSDHDKKCDGIDNNDEIQIKELPENSENIVSKILVNETENLISADNLRETVISGTTTGITILSDIVIKEPNQTTDQQNLFSESLLTNQQKVEDCRESIIMSTTTEKNDKDPIINEDKLKTEIDTVAANVSKSNSSFMDLKDQHSIHESPVNIIAKGLEIIDCTVTDFQTENSCDSESILSHNCILDQDNEAKQCLKEKGVARYLDTDYVENKIENNDVPEKIEPQDKLNNVHTYSLDRCMSNSREDLLKTLSATGDSISVTQTQVEEHTTYNTNTHKQKTGEFQEIQQTSDLSFCIDKDDFLNIEIKDKPETLSEITEYLNTNKENDKATVHTANRTTENSVLSNVPTNSHTKSFKCINDTTAPSTSDKYLTKNFKNNSNIEIIDEYTSVKKNVIETNNVDNERAFVINTEFKDEQKPTKERIHIKFPSKPNSMDVSNIWTSSKTTVIINSDDDLIELDDDISNATNINTHQENYIETVSIDCDEEHFKIDIEQTNNYIKPEPIIFNSLGLSADLIIVLSDDEDYIC